MDDPKQAELQEKALNDEIRNYQKLDKINKSEEFNNFFDLQISTATQKILTCFTGKGPQNWEEFCRIRGEVVGIILPIQQVRGAKVMAKQIRDQLDNIYNQEVD